MTLVNDDYLSPPKLTGRRATTIINTPNHETLEPESHMTIGGGSPPS
jgi:hypothetical protein